MIWSTEGSITSALQQIDQVDTKMHFKALLRSHYLMIMAVLV